MEGTARQELKMTLMNVKEIEDRLRSVISTKESIEGKIDFWSENPRATELGAQLLQVHELKLKVINQLNNI